MPTSTPPPPDDVTPEESYRRRLIGDAARLRGMFLDMACYIEAVIDDILAYSLCPLQQQRELFRSLILSRGDLSFSSKIEILQGFLKLRHRQLLDEALFKELAHFRRFRNRPDHPLLDRPRRHQAEYDPIDRRLAPIPPSLEAPCRHEASTV